MNRDVLVSIICIVASLFLYYSLGWIDDERARAFPRVVIIIMGILSALLLIQTLALKKGQASGQAVPVKRFLIMFAAVILYLIFMEKIGFYASAFLFIILVTTLFGKAGFNFLRIISRAAISAAFVGVLFVLFHILLKVQTPAGCLF